MKKEKDHSEPEKDISNAYDVMCINFDLIQRMRFLNADQHIAPEDSYTTGDKQFND